jgi:pimeloyl-ACP methyl ester carboxylesterase
LNIEHGYININGSRIFYEQAGSGQPLILIHGNMLDRRMWDFNFLALALRFRVIRYDQRGFGRSGHADGQFSAADRDLLALLDQLNLPNAALCGSSMGGVVATHFAFLHPQRTTALILVNTDLSGFAVTGDIADAILETRHALENGDTNRAVEIWLNHPMLLPTQRYPQAYQLLQDIVTDYSWHNWLAGKAYLITPPVLNRMKEIQTNTLIIIGQNDLPRFLAIADMLHRKIPHSQRITIPDSAHLTAMEQPDPFNQSLINFLLSDNQK